MGDSLSYLDNLFVQVNTHNLTLVHHRVLSSSVVEHPTRSLRVVGSNPLWDSDLFRVYVSPRIYIISTLIMFNFTFRVHSFNLSIQCQFHESHFRYGALFKKEDAYGVCNKGCAYKICNAYNIYHLQV